MSCTQTMLADAARRDAVLAIATLLIANALPGSVLAQQPLKKLLVLDFELIGALPALKSLLQTLPEPFPGSIVVALHGPRSSRQSALRDILDWRSRFNVTWANEGEPLLGNHIHVCPQGLDTRITAWQTFRSETGLDRFKPSVNRLFESAADVFGKDAIGVVLSGYLDDGASGAKRIVDAGGTIFVQDRASARPFDMPLATLASGVSALQLPPTGLATAIAALLFAPGARAWFKVSNDSRYAATA